MLLIAVLSAIALVFDFLNGLHDAANSIATIVSTRVLSPRYAVAWAAFFNFIAFAVFGLHVAATVGTGIVAPAIIDDHIIFGALMGAIVWNIVTWVAGIPSSSSHALIGGLVGAGVGRVSCVQARVCANEEARLAPRCAFFISSRCSACARRPSHLTPTPHTRTHTYIQCCRGPVP